MSRVIVIGLTGNIATGKSTVMAMLTQRGAFAIDADKIVHYLLDTDELVQSLVTARFGSEICSKEGSVDRAKLAAIVFQDSAEMKDLEAILHPQVGSVVDDLIRNSQSSVIAIEAIKLLESDLWQRCQSIWVTTCREEQQVQRLLASRGMTRDDALTRIRSQSPQAEKLSHADAIIDTSGSLEQT
jgi:dephospho-CoA kinase